MPPPLPLEIMQQIFSYFQINNLNRKGTCDTVSLKDQAEIPARLLTLSHLSRTSKSFRRMVLPILYHTIPKTSIPLLKTLSADAGLAGLVKAIDLSPVKIPQKVLREVLEELRSRIFLPAGFESRLVRAINMVVPGAGWRDTGAEAVLHLLQLRNLEEIEYRTAAESIPLVNDFFGGAAGQALVPRQLSQLRLRRPENEPTPRVSDVHQLLLPTLKAVHGREIKCNLRNPIFDNLGPLALENIDLVDATVDEATIDAMLLQCPNLRILRIAAFESRVTPRFNYGLLGDILRSRGRGLVKFVLAPLDKYVYNQMDGRLGSLRELTKLRQLKVPQGALVTSTETLRHDADGTPEQWLTLDDVLPDTLESLLLMACENNADIDGQVCDLIWKERLENLNYILLKGRSTFSMDVAELGWSVSLHKGAMLLDRDIYEIY